MNLLHRRASRIAIAIGATTLAMASCSSTPPGQAGQSPAAASGDAKGLVIGHSYQNLDNQFFSDELAAERALAQERGHQVVDVQADNNPAKQLDDINSLIARGVNVLAIDAVDPAAIVPALDAAERAGIPVISLIAEPEGGKYKALVYLDSVKDGANGCQKIIDELGGKGKVVILTGPLQILAAKQRADGCRKKLQSQQGIEIVAEVNTDYSLRDAEQKMTDVLQSHPEVDAVFGGNDDIALGAIRALDSAGKNASGKVIVGVDGTKAALQAICDGDMTTTLATFPKAEAQIVVDTAEKIAAGDPVESKVLFPAVPVDAANVVDRAVEAGVTLTGCGAGDASGSSAATTTS